MTSYRIALCLALAFTAAALIAYGCRPEPQHSAATPRSLAQLQMEGYSEITITDYSARCSDGIGHAWKWSALDPQGHTEHGSFCCDLAQCGYLQPPQAVQPEEMGR